MRPHSPSRAPAIAAENQADAEQPSKSRRKREMQALQALGEALVSLSAEQLGRIELPDALRAAVRDAQGFRMEARRRQLQYIGKLMRTIDPAPIRHQLDALQGVSAQEVARNHQLERLRERLLADESVVGELVERWPQTDVQHLRNLRRKALREREQGKAPAAFREIFRLLRRWQMLEEEAAASFADDDAASGQ